MPNFSFKVSILPSILNILGMHWVGHNLKGFKKSLVTLPMGILMPPSKKAIIGIMTAPIDPLLCHSP